MTLLKITCLSVGVYGDALTRGRIYEALSIDDEKKQVKLRGNNNRIRCFPINHFDLKGNPAPVLTEWWYMDLPSEGDCTEVGFQLNDGTSRWCLFATPEKLDKMLTRPGADPGIWLPHLIVTRSEGNEILESMLRYLDQQGQLLQASMPSETFEANAAEITAKIVCPRCEQDWLMGATITPLHERIWICPECDAFWNMETLISFETFRDWSLYMEERGYEGDWKLLKLSE